MSQIELVAVTKRFGHETAVDQLSLVVPEGRLVSFLGPSGCGKTTVLRMIAGFLNPDEGQIRVDGVRINDVPAADRGFGMVFQSYSLFPNMTVAQNVAFPLQIKKVGKQQIAKRVTELLEMIGIPQQRDKYPDQLSGGQQQRVALARAIAAEPKLLLLDEPLSALDATVREQLRSEIKRLQQKSGITTLFVTHDQQEALSISDFVAVISQGKVAQFDTPIDVYRSPASEFVASFVGSTNRVKVNREAGSSWTSGSLRFDGPASGTQAWAYLRPEEIEVIAAAGGNSKVVGLTFLGSQVRYEVETLAGDEIVLVDLPAGKALDLAIGDRVSLSTSRKDPLILPVG
jgi:ABC-type Fe3+/spermidine/putrescine transport system ATPase subunit